MRIIEFVTRLKPHLHNHVINYANELSYLYCLFCVPHNVIVTG